MALGNKVRTPIRKLVALTQALSTWPASAKETHAAAQAAAHRQEQAACQAICVRKAQVKKDKAAGITQNADDSNLKEWPDTVFTSQSVTTKPTPIHQKAISAHTQPGLPITKCTSKVPPTPTQYLAESDSKGDEDCLSDNQFNLGSDLNNAMNEDPIDNDKLFQDDEPSPSMKLIGSMMANLTMMPFHVATLPTTYIPSSPSNKRGHSDSLDESTSPAPSKAKKIMDNTGRPKASDYDDVSKEIILAAANVYHCLISTVNGFPDSGTELEFVCTAWKHAIDDANIQPLNLTPDIGKIIRKHGSQTCDEAKSKTASMVETIYGFGSGHGQKTVGANQKLAEDLKHEKGFVYKTLLETEHKGIYQHPIIQKAVNRLWFKNKHDEGVIYTDMFKPLPIPAIALVLTAIECNINEWMTGVKMDIAFYDDDYRRTYQKHIESLTVFGQETMKYQLLERVQKQLHNYGRVA
ncbi:hypothetical protein C0995_000742 [Termitomyces sp. Mi166|nr:hypothetical protein C0995_000742 [Termitomyces sp. Mi166\